MAVELEPYVVYRILGGQVECATWQLAEGPQALALFSTQDNANAYLRSAGLDGAWRVYRPARSGVLELLRASAAAGYRHAVLDPDRERAKRVFDIVEILAAVQAAGMA